MGAVGRGGICVAVRTCVCALLHEHLRRACARLRVHLRVSHHFMSCTMCMYVHQEPLCACAPSSTLRMGSKVPSLRGSKASPCPSMEKECKPHNKKFLCTPKFNLHVKHNVHVCASTSTLCISRCVLLTSHQVYVKFLSKMVLVVMNCAWLTTSFHVHRLHGNITAGRVLDQFSPNFCTNLVNYCVQMRATHF